MTYLENISKSRLHVKSFNRKFAGVGKRDCVSFETRNKIVQLIVSHGGRIRVYKHLYIYSLVIFFYQIQKEIKLPPRKFLRSRLLSISTFNFTMSWLKICRHQIVTVIDSVCRYNSITQAYGLLYTNKKNTFYITLNYIDTVFIIISSARGSAVTSDVLCFDLTVS